MKQLSLEEFEQSTEDYNKAVLASAHLATYCSVSEWVLAAHQHLHPQREAIILREGDAWLAFSYGMLADQFFCLHPLEASWCFSCPLIGNDEKALLHVVQAFAKRCKQFETPIFIGGIKTESLFLKKLAETLSYNYEVKVLPGSESVQADIRGDIEAYLSRRSRKFRANLRKAITKAANERIAFDHIQGIADGVSIFQRALAVEQRSWKFAAGESIFQNERHKAFYQQLLHLAGKAGRLRAVFAKKDNLDIAYCIGGVLGTAFRGFQLGYDSTFTTYSLGNLAQFEMIKLLIDEGIHIYDLGMDIEYKRRWADNVIPLSNLFIAP